MYLLDTNIVSEARRGSPEAVNWLRSVEPSHLYLSVVTLGEIMRGATMKQRADPATAGRLTQWLQALRRDYASRILPVDAAVAIEWGRLSASRPRGDADGLIAATATVHALALVTRNVRDFDDLPLRVIDPWN